jgi:predicted transcriptional regulator
MKRHRLEIIYDILSVIRNKEGLKPTHVMYKANLSHKLMDDYLNELLEKKFVTQKNNKKQKMYHITDKGIKYIEKYSVIIDFVDTFGLK